ncbi:Protein of unknown function [Cotesia congregata]|uniref:Uncharacterized protein n=1 Tax=Cotesia congregata TaxID=51543 RepID=A0A8J2MNA5_COTCN|nr:Protein of unknown function [Cotesia congregata]
MNNLLHDHICRVIEAVAPLREVEVRDQPAPWVTQDIRILQRRRSKLYRIFKRSRFAYKEYSGMRKFIKRRIADAKKEYFDNRLSNLVKRLDVRAAPDLNLDEMNAYFVTAAGSPLQNIDFEYLEARIVKHSNSFELKELTSVNVRQTCMMLTSGSVGPDHFEIKTYKVLLPYFLSHITNLFNFSLSSEWCVKNGLNMNRGKMKAMIFGTVFKLADLQHVPVPNTIINNTVIGYCKSVKYLGVVLEDTLTWSLQVNEICKSTMRILAQLKMNDAFSFPVRCQLRRGDVRNDSLVVPGCYSTKYDEFFLVSAIRVWNRLPSYCTAQPTFPTFRKACYEFLLSEENG